MAWFIFTLLSCLKILFIPAYRSTDFEVHRNWLAITHSLPISKWYYENTSEWTLDYPPLFAWFEYFLSHIAKLFDPKMLIVKNLNYSSFNTILFQRLSVIFTDLMLAYGTKECCKYIRQSGLKKSSRWRLTWSSPTSVLSMLLLANAGLLMVDHIHFQYNGFLFGILLLSIAKMLQEKYLISAFWFAVLLNLKHIFMYVAPAYFIYLFRNYCIITTIVNEKERVSLNLRRMIKLGSIGLFVLLISFGPFLLMGQIGQVFSRLFPFKRGLCHAYWAPNFWALYNMADKIGYVTGKALGFTIKNGTAVMTGGLVQEFQHIVLPTITPKITFICTFLSIIPALIKLWLSPKNPLHFVRSIILCAYGAFMFGWHVHEKAVLLIIIPLSILAVVWKKEAKSYLILSTVGHYSLTPLLFTPMEIPLKALIVLAFAAYAFIQLHQMFDMQGRIQFHLPLLSHLETIYILGLIPLFLYQHIIHGLFGSWSDKYQFLPLMLTSVYCSLGVTYSWFKYYWHFLSMGEGKHKRKIH